MIALAGIIAIIHLAVYITAKDAVEEQLKRNAKSVAISVAYNVMETIEDYKSFVEAKDVQTEYYQKKQTYFANLKAGSNIKYICTEHRIDAKTVKVVLGDEPPGNPDHSPPGSVASNDPEKETVFSTKRPAGFKLVKYGSWRVLLSAYAPIFDRDGEMLGIVGVVIDGSRLYHYLGRLQMVLLIIYTIIIGMTLFILLKFSNAVLEPLFKDKLTGAYSKRYSEQLIQEEIAAAVKNHKDLALMMLDLDHFKSINDTYGHGFGDKVLSSVSEAIHSALRQKDYFIRYGGEEFIALFPQVNEKRAQEIAERIRRAVEENEIFNEERNIPVKMTISIGIASLKQPALSVQEFINRADKALYAAKEGRNCVAVFES